MGYNLYKKGYGIQCMGADKAYLLVMEHTAPAMDAVMDPPLELAYNEVLFAMVE